ncbi:Mth938-like domain-containing protein, partial [Thiolapillus sp.]|uniref:Mth938-like domain-containing protein n=1 Tax=Thiolapillus sp. TaxID=2017437 RepID=UPI003AF75819
RRHCSHNSGRLSTILSSCLPLSRSVTALQLDSRMRHWLLASHQPDVILLGSGTNQLFPHPSLFIPLMQAGIGYEIMPTHAACRTYNILLAEDRRVLAALIL